MPQGKDKKTADMSDKKKETKKNNPEEGTFELSKTEEAANSIIEAAKHTGNEITYSEINSLLSDVSLDKDALEEVYDLVESKGISILETREPTSSQLEDDLSDDDLLDFDLDIDLDDDITGIAPPDGIMILR